MTITQEIEKRIISVAYTRAAIARGNARADALQEEIDELALCQKLRDERLWLGEMKCVLASSETALRCAVLEHFEEGGDKKPHPAVTVKIFKTLTYNDTAMLDWAIEHKHNQVLKLNASAFKKLANAIDVPGVVKAKEPRVMIARDLSKYERDSNASPTD